MNDYKLIIGDKEIELSPGVTKIGRASDSDIVLEDRRVSSQHAQIELIQGKLYIKDLNSRNGTFVNGSRVHKTTELSDGNIIQIITYKFKVKMPEPAVKPDKTILDLSRPCPKCGQRVSREYQFCPYCGSNVKIDEKEPTVVVEEEPAEAKMAPTSYTSETVPTPQAAPPIRGDVSATGPTVLKEDALQLPAEKAAAPALPLRRTTEEVEKKVLAIKNPAGFWLRLVAYFLDVIFINLISIPAVALQSWLILYFMGENVSSLMQGLRQGSIAVTTTLYMLYSLASLLYSVIAILYILSGWARKGETWGKRILGLKIYTKQGKTPIGWGKAILRFIGYFVSSMILCIGFLMIGFTNRKRGLHDMIAGTYVVRDR